MNGRVAAQKNGIHVHLVRNAELARELLEQTRDAAIVYLVPTRLPQLAEVDVRRDMRERQGAAAGEREDRGSRGTRARLAEIHRHEGAAGKQRNVRRNGDDGDLGRPRYLQRGVFRLGTVRRAVRLEPEEDQLRPALTRGARDHRCGAPGLRTDAEVRRLPDGLMQPLADGGEVLLPP